MNDFKSSNNTKLVFIKIIHTVIWILFVLIIAFVLYAGITNQITIYVWIAVGLVVLEGVLLLVNDRKCPLTPIAARYTESTEPNFDIFLPKWLAKNNKLIFTSIFAVGVVLVVWRAVE